MSTIAAKGLKLPLVGLGTWALRGKECARLVEQAIRAGYRHIDTAQMYENEAAVGEGVRASGHRNDVIITTKVAPTALAPHDLERSVKESLAKLRVDFIDLLLIHWPNPWQGRFVDAWRGMLRLREEGSVRAIGVSNFLPKHIDELLAATGVAPEVNQIELDPTLPRGEWRAYHSRHGIHSVGWSPLGRGGDLLRDPIVLELADLHGKSPAQIVLRWQIEIGTGFVARSSDRERIAQNLDLFDFALGSEGMRRLAALDQGRQPARDPESHGH